jgi:hypothetical protein
MTTKDFIVRRQRGAPVIEHAYNQVRSFNDLKGNAHSLHRMDPHGKPTVRTPNNELRPPPSGPEQTAESCLCTCGGTGRDWSIFQSQQCGWEEEVMEGL